MTIRDLQVGLSRRPCPGRFCELSGPVPPRRLWRGSTAMFAVALFAAAPNARADASSGLIVGGINLSASPTETLFPGGTVYADSHKTSGTSGGPQQSAEYLYLTPTFGFNFSGRSTNIQSAFSSSLIQTNGNGAVGVSGWSASAPERAKGATGQLTALADWQQTFTYTGADEVELVLRLHIPELQVGLLGVSPNRSAVSKTESAQTSATVDTVIVHADATQDQARNFEYGLREEEVQLPLGPGIFSNAADLSFIGDPFGVDAVSDHSITRVVQATAVSEPNSVVIMLLGTLALCPGRRVSTVKSIAA